MSLDTFKQNIIDFIDELYKQSSYNEFIIAHIYIDNKLDIKNCMDSCIKDIEQFKLCSKNKDMDSLLQLSMLNDHSIFLRKLWYSSLLDNSDKEIIWKWIELIIYDIIQYQTNCEIELIKKND